MATASVTRYAEDFALYADHGLTHHRLSLEWARLEPEQGKHDPAAVEHYRQMLTAARDAGISVWACLHHFTLPGWFSDDGGGFIDKQNRLHWHRHVDWVAETFGDLLTAGSRSTSPSPTPCSATASACTRRASRRRPVRRGARGDPPGQPRGLAAAQQRRSARRHDPQPHAGVRRRTRQ